MAGVFIFTDQLDYSMHMDNQMNPTTNHILMI